MGSHYHKTCTLTIGVVQILYLDTLQLCLLSRVVEDRVQETDLEEDNRVTSVGVVDMVEGDKLKVVGMVEDKQVAEMEGKGLMDKGLNVVGMKQTMTVVVVGKQ